MDYYKIVFNSENAWHKFQYGFQIDLANKELVIVYDNLLGGYTNKGINLNESEMEHLDYILKKNRFEKYRNNSLLEIYQYPLDPNEWQLKLFPLYNSGILEIPSKADDNFYAYAPPNIIKDLVCYVTKIGIEQDTLKRMRFF